MEERDHREVGDNYDLSGAIIMTDFPEIRRILGAAFSIGTGLSDDASTALLKRALENKEWRERFLENELIQAFSASTTRWADLLFNDQYEVFESETEEEAREFASKILWEPTFCHEPVPVADQMRGQRRVSDGSRRRTIGTARRPGVAPGGIAFYAVNRCAVRLAVFDDLPDYFAFEKVLAEAAMSAWACCLMPRPRLD